MTQLHWQEKWEKFKLHLPHQHEPYSKRNWGHELHSLCSYQGKMKPSLAHHLIETFTEFGDHVFDPFSGVGTIPLEAALSKRVGYGMDLSELAVVLTAAKLGYTGNKEVFTILKSLEHDIASYKMTHDDVNTSKEFGFNGKLVDFFHPETLREIFAARKFIQRNYSNDPDFCLMVSAILHVLHGNRPYALSRRSHPITPYAPTGDFEYKSLIEKVKSKIDKTIKLASGVPAMGHVWLHGDATSPWPPAIDNLDAIITSPPFFDSTKFHMANWMRLWMMGWEAEDFKQRPSQFVDELQKQSMDIYNSILLQSRLRLKREGVMVMHLGKSHKMDMGAAIIKIAGRHFRSHELFDESVEHCESHGIMDKGSVKGHQYLVLSNPYQ